MKTLYFEGAGWSGADISKATVGNCRIRTAFHLDSGEAVYLELNGCAVSKRHSDEIKKFAPYAGFVDSCHYITDDKPNDDINKHNIIHRNYKVFSYTEEGILELVNSLGASFDAIKVLPDLGGYRVFPSKNTANGPDGYYYGDEFEPDWETIKRAEAVHDHFYELEKSEGKKYPNFSLWTDEKEPGLLHLLRHFNGFNKHWTIDARREDWIDTITETGPGRNGFCAWS